jgi:hypothetical protein
VICGRDSVENALLRERINDTAAEFARLVLALEGLNSPIEAILATAPKSLDGEAISAISRTASNGDLADRIRALMKPTAADILHVLLGDFHACSFRPLRHEADHCARDETEDQQFPH